LKGDTDRLNEEQRILHVKELPIYAAHLIREVMCMGGTANAYRRRSNVWLTVLKEIRNCISLYHYVKGMT
jgi:hypothetical protein